MEPKEWEQSFDKEFGENYGDHSGEQIKEFIRSLLLEKKKKAIEAMGEEEPLPKTKCINAENHLFGSCFQCERIKGRNEHRAEALKRLELL